jgi:RimJ/RimL family protein N-acetyltransferase
MSDPRIPQASELRRTFRGELVTVEPLAAAHEGELLEAARDGSLFDWLPEDPGSSREAIHAWLSWSLDAAAADLEVPFAIRSHRTGRVVGSSRFHEIRLKHLRVEIGWTWLAQSVHGTGVNVETKLLLLTHAFEEVGCRRVEFKADARNARSCGALEALGARYEGTFRKHMVVRHGAVRDSAYYAVIDDDWPSVKSRLEDRLAKHRQAGPSRDS